MMTPFHWLSILKLSLLASHVAGSKITITFGASGEPCGALGRKCLNTESCNQTTKYCDCKDPSDIGDGYTQCYENNTIRAEVVNDPSFRGNNDNPQTQLHIPCRYLLSHVETKFKVEESPGVYNEAGWCEFVTHAFHYKLKGKFVVGGFDVAMKFNVNGTVSKKSLRIYGFGWGILYAFQFNQTNGMFLPQGPWKNDPIPVFDSNNKLWTYSVPRDNLAGLRASSCGVRITFRPFSIYKGKNQVQTPFVSFSALPFYEPRLKSVDKILSPPVDQNGNPILMPGLDMEQTLMVRALSSNATQNSPIANSQCSLSGPKLDACHPNILPTALTRCGFILKLPRFIKCYDKTSNGEKIMELFNSCIDIYCTSIVSCQSVIDNITASNCHVIQHPYPDVTDFINGKMCSV